MRVLVCGGRDFNDLEMLTATLDEIHKATPIEVIIHGDAKGADKLAGVWARDNSVPIEKYPADWSKYGKSAGFRRNTQMLTEGKPDLVVAMPGGVGTAMMVDIARKASVKVRSRQWPKPLADELVERQQEALDARGGSVTSGLEKVLSRRTI